MAQKSSNMDFDKLLHMIEVSAQPLSYQTMSDMDYQMAAFALREFERGHYNMCLKALEHLKDSRPQDVKVLHNIHVVEFFITECTEVVELYCNLQNVCYQEYDDSDVDSVDDVDQCVLFYNMAIIMFQLHRANEAIYILERISQLFDPLEEPLGRKIFLSLMSAHIAAYEPQKAIFVANYMEGLFSQNSLTKSGKPGDDGKEVKMVEDEKLRLALNRARCYAMMKNTKLCKREVKVLMASGIKAKQIAAFFIRSQLEYQRGNHKKAIKIINSAEWPKETVEFFFETGDCLPAVYNNNLGCIMFAMGKPRLGAFYIERGLKELSEELKIIAADTKGDQSGKPMHTHCLDERVAMTYNLAMQYFKLQDFKIAFRLFIEVSEFYQNNPRLWLRIAECCIQADKEKAGHAKDTKILRSILGSGTHRKISLNPSHTEFPSVETNLKESVASLTLDYAIVALHNALLLLMPPNDSVSSESKNESNVSALLSEERDLEDNSSGISVTLRPCFSSKEADVEDVRNAVLLASSYVSLRLGDLIMAREYAAQLLLEPRISESQKFLAHVYAGEALVKMDKISEAVEHFNSYASADMSLNFALSEIKNDEPDRSDDPPWVPSDSVSSLIPAKLIAQYNLSLVYAMRGEYSKALKLANEVMSEENAPVQIKALIVYIHLSRGATEQALSYLQEKRPKILSFLSDDL